MHRIANWDWRVAAGVFVFLNLLCAGLGMGVPILNIGLGFVVGWYLAARALMGGKHAAEMMTAILRGALWTSGMTFLLMVLIWAPWLRMLSDAEADLAHFGIPMLLYEPRASFIAWEVLMIGLSPFFQLLTTILAAFIKLWRGLLLYEYVERRVLHAR